MARQNQSRFGAGPVSGNRVCTYPECLCDVPANFDRADCERVKERRDHKQDFLRFNRGKQSRRQTPSLPTVSFLKGKDDDDRR